MKTIYQHSETGATEYTNGHGDNIQLIQAGGRYTVVINGEVVQGAKLVSEKRALDFIGVLTGDNVPTGHNMEFMGIDDLEPTTCYYEFKAKCRSCGNVDTITGYYPYINVKKQITPLLKCSECGK